ncbi:endoglucanase B [Verticillium alfalfae VaMs.102]|uniref:lytic cellulose monooxygenase (C4-dehydrogenating) n=1 Tax=Verticillium alfalfae (strain VaMs.102 / ATCC MYA-4576 / FGSC 10136) TaxID=526221 RepID=C9S9R8_VERA1|nr:endoglucanase B [Verticillium alfalfae VaMs.102]EEY16131.1 endoglucanase B [Verticillium alfalfae VaMs.102]
MRSTLGMFALLSMAHGHATFQQFWIDGVDQGSTCARLPPGNSPIEDVASNNLRCNIGGASGVAGICEVPAGSMIEVEMHEQPGDRDCEKPAIGGNHHGPVMVYLAAVPDATIADGSDPFFKIGEIPETCLWRLLGPRRGYSLHSAGQLGAAQFYMTCYQIKVTNGGSASIPSGDHPGIHINIWVDDIDAYVIPGPPIAEI